MSKFNPNRYREVADRSVSVRLLCCACNNPYVVANCCNDRRTLCSECAMESLHDGRIRCPACHQKHLATVARLGKQPFG